MSLEKAIQKLTEVISAAKLAPGAPDGSPIGREMKPRNPCSISYPKGHPSYCYCYKQKKRDFAGECYFTSGNKCYRLTYTEESMNPSRQVVDCGSSGIDGGPNDSPIS